MAAKPQGMSPGVIGGTRGDCDGCIGAHPAAGAVEEAGRETIMAPDVARAPSGALHG